MDPTELHQFLFVCVLAFAALIAAPIVAYLAEASERRAEREHRRRERPWATPRFV